MIIYEGKIAFNPGGDPTYGLTSLAYLLVVLPMRAERLFPLVRKRRLLVLRPEDRRK